MTLAALLLALACPASPPSAPLQAPVPAIVPVDGEEFTGRVHLVAATPGGEARAPAHAAIRDQRAYEGFVALIPAREISMTEPAAPSADPLLALPPVDFGRHMLVVLFRADDMYARAELVGVEPREGGAVVRYRLPPAELQGASAHGIGTYRAILVPRVEGEIAFEEVR